MLFIKFLLAMMMMMMMMMMMTIVSGAASSPHRSTSSSSTSTISAKKMDRYPFGWGLDDLGLHELESVNVLATNNNNNNKKKKNNAENSNNVKQRGRSDRTHACLFLPEMMIHVVLLLYCLFFLDFSY
jgi:hypothetical protein